MGAVLEKDSVNFALEIKEDEKASLLIYKKGQKEPEAEIPQEEAEQIGNIVAWRLKKFPYKRLEYNYKIGEENETGLVSASLIRGRKKIWNDHKGT